MFKKMFTIGTLLVVAAATVLVTPDSGQAQQYYSGNYGVRYPYYQPYYGYYRPYYGYQRLYGPSYGYQGYYRPYYGDYYYAYPGNYGAYPTYSFYPNVYLWR
jgi:hypothetical protein